MSDIQLPGGWKFVDEPPQVSDVSLPEGWNLVEPSRDDTLPKTKINLTLPKFADPEEEAARINNSEFVAEHFSVEPGEAYDHVDEYLTQLTGEEKPPHKKFTQEVQDVWNYGQQQVELGKLRWRQMLTAESEEMNLEVDTLKGKMMLPETAERSLPVKALLAAIEMAPVMWAGIKRGAKTGLVSGAGGAATAAILGQMGPQVGLPEEIVTIPGAFLTLFSVGMATGSAQEIVEIEGGLAYDEMLVAGVDPQIAKPIGITVGVINGLIETAQISELFKTIPGGQTLLRKAVTRATKKIIAEGGLKKIALRFATQYGKHITFETAQEIIQEVVTILGTEIGKEFQIRRPGGRGVAPVHATPEEILNRLKDTAIHSALAFAVMVLPGTGTSSILEARRAQKAGPVRGPVGTEGKVEKMSPEQEELLKTVSEGYRTETTTLSFEERAAIEIGAVPETIEPAPAIKEAMKESRVVEIEGEKYTRKEVRRARDEARETKVSELVQEIAELKTGTGKRAVGKAYTAGKEVGVAQHKKATHAARLKGIARREQREHLNKIIHDLKKVQSKLDVMSEAHAAPIRELINGLDFTKPRESTVISLEKTRKYFENNPEVEISDSIKERLETLDKRSIRDLSMDEVEDIYTAVMHHAHLENRKQQIRIGLKDHRATLVIAQAMNEMKAPKQISAEIVSSKITPVEKAKAVGRKLKNFFGLRHNHYDLVIEQLAGPNSTMDKVLFAGVKEGITEQLRYPQETFRAYQKDLEKAGFKREDTDAWLNERVKVGKFDLTRNERMTLYNHFLNEDNRESMISDGLGLEHGPDPNQIYTITDRTLMAIMNSLTSDERAFAGAPVRNLFEKQYDRLNPVFKEKNGYELPKEDIYFPKDVMPISRGMDIEKESALEQFRGQWTRVGLEKGMLERRRRVNKPIYIHPLTEVINRSVRNAAAYIGLEIPLSDASKLLYNKNFRGQMTLRYGKETWNEIEKGLRDIAGEQKSYTDVQKGMLKMRARLSTAILGLNPFVMFKQPLSYSMYSTYVKPKYLLQGIVDYATHPKELIERHKLYSPEYLERIEGGFSRDVQEVTKKAGTAKRLYKGKAKLPEKMMGGIKWFDKQTVTPGMQGAVLQVLSEFQEEKLSEEVRTALDMRDKDIAKLTAEEKMQKAYRFAEWATNRTQPTFAPEHRSSISRGAPLEKMMTQFTTFTNQALNLLRRTVNDAVRSKNKLATKRAARAIVSVMLVNTIGNIAIDELRNRIYGRDDDDKIYTRLLKNWVSMFYIVRDVFQSLTSKIEKGTYAGYDFSVPVLRYLNTVVSAGAHFVRMFSLPSRKKRHKEALRCVDKTAEMLLTTFGIPYSTPKKMVERVIEEVKD